MSYSDADLITAVVVPFGLLVIWVFFILCVSCGPPWRCWKKNARKVCCFEQTICALFTLCANNIFRNSGLWAAWGGLYLKWSLFFLLIVFYTKILVLVYCNTNVSILGLVLFTQVTLVKQESVTIQNQSTEAHQALGWMWLRLDSPASTYALLSLLYTALYLLGFY